MMFDINQLEWDDIMLNELNIPKSILPKVQPSCSHFGDYEMDGHHIPIVAIMGDQQAALFGQACFSPGSSKNTYGTGCFMLVNTGEKPKVSQNGLLTTIAWGIDGAAIQWLRDALQIIETSEETETLAKEVADDHSVYFVPAFVGLGAPHWDMYARGSIFGLTRDTGKAHIAKATLEALAFQTKDMIRAMQKDAGFKISALHVDGGACNNDYLMQFQANILNRDVIKPQNIQSTVMGVAYMAGIYLKWWNQGEIDQTRKIGKVYRPDMPKEMRKKRYRVWKKAVKRSMAWLED
ncbi:unnamed protein product [Cyprideis torosa]|uniref:glycerol kinase n=1 Tax=Cyprideis torosa TaxID=163714 RepID=A0A7R8WTM7_9CRUS|nr:unnamed protein product [Cyprideis torosa]CAG0910133.1 unnamed protein product [Cyprideis torosa]